jgi:uncharacterized membrane protein YhiD involved in acid resistance
VPSTDTLRPFTTLTTGAGLIFKQAQKDEHSGDVTHVVHGLTTAASLWLSAAVGVACGGALYFAATFGSAVMLVLLRFGPRIADSNDDDVEEENEEDEELGDLRGVVIPERERRNSETSSLLHHSDRDVSRDSGGKTASMRKRAHLGNLV